MRAFWVAAWAGALALAACCGGHVPAAASLRVSPLVVEGRVQEGGSPLGPVYVSNAGRVGLPVRVELVELSHDLQGHPVFSFDPASRARASELLRPSWEQEELSPGEGRELWLLPSAAARTQGAYVAALIGAPVPTGTLQVAVLVLLRGASGPAEAPLLLEGVWAEQEAPGNPVDVVARVRNPGASDGWATVEATVVAADGSVHGRLTLGPQRVLPNAARLLRARWQPAVLPPGRYVVQATLNGGAPPVPASTASLDVVRPYELARVSGSVSVAVGTAGPQPSLVASLHNRSPRPVRPVLEVRVTGPRGPVASARVEGPEVQPAGVVGVRLPWPPGLPPGQYRVEVAWVDGFREVASDAVEVSLAVPVARGPGERGAP